MLNVIIPRLVSTTSYCSCQGLLFYGSKCLNNVLRLRNYKLTGYDCRTEFYIHYAWLRNNSRLQAKTGYKIESDLRGQWQVESEKERNDVQWGNNYLDVLPSLLICSFLRGQMSHPHFLLVNHQSQLETSLFLFCISLHSVPLKSLK